jgi:hypothetical protein
MYARGILFGKMKYELGDQSIVRCPELDLVAEIDFKVKGWVSGTYNAIGGSIKVESTGEILYELSGLWSEQMTITNVAVSCPSFAHALPGPDPRRERSILGGSGKVLTCSAVKTGHQDMFFDARKSKSSPPLVRPIEDQEERESQRLWRKVVQAVKDCDHTTATDEKTLVEDRQREEAAARVADGVEWTPRLFRRVRGGPGGSEEGMEDLEWVINTHMCVVPHNTNHCPTLPNLAGSR